MRVREQTRERREKDARESKRGVRKTSVGYVRVQPPLLWDHSRRSGRYRCFGNRAGGFARYQYRRAVVIFLPYAAMHEIVRVARFKGFDLSTAIQMIVWKDVG